MRKYRTHDIAVKWLEQVNTLVSFEGGHGKLPEVGWGDLFAHCPFVPSAQKCLTSNWDYYLSS